MHLDEEKRKDFPDGIEFSGEGLDLFDSKMSQVVRTAHNDKPLD